MNLLSALSMGVLFVVAFQNCGQFNSTSWSTSSSLSSTSTGLGSNPKAEGFAMPARGLGSKFTLATSDKFKIFNSGYEPSIVFYVDGELGNDSQVGSSVLPFRTLAKAQASVQEALAKGESDIVVVLRGEIRVDQPLSFGAADSAMAGHFVAYISDSLKPATISGAVNLSNEAWKPSSQYSGVYTRSVGKSVFRDLYINGVKAVRAKSGVPFTAAKIGSGDVIDCTGCGLGTIAQPLSVEVSFAAAWQAARCVGTLSSSGSITLKYPCSGIALHNVVPVTSVISVENTPGLIKNAGDWALDTVAGTLYYKPRSGETLDSAVVSVSQAPKLIVATDLSNTAFIGIKFRQTYWSQVMSDVGFASHQADVYRNGEAFDWGTYAGTDWMPAAFECTRCSTVMISDSEFSDLGASAIRVGKGSQNTLLFHNSIHDIAGSGLQIGDPSATDLTTQVKGTIVEDNEIAHIGTDFYSSPGIFQYYAVGTSIANNEIHDMPYSGISIGWGWTLAQVPNSQNNRVYANHVYNVMGYLQDGGAIYFNAAMAGSEVSHNFVHDVLAGLPGVNPYPSAMGVYLDNGCSGILVNNNATANITSQALFLQNILAPFAENNSVTSDGVDEITIRYLSGARALPLPPGTKIGFGGMFGSGGVGEYKNPVTGNSTCPANYKRAQLLGTFGLDWAIYYCYKELKANEEPLYDFGGMFGYSFQKTYPNPYTGADTCPAGFTGTQVLGTTNTDWPMYMCMKPHVAGTVSEFHGLFGWGERTLKKVAYENPLTGEPSCPAGKTATDVFGTASFDWPVAVCR